MKTAEEMRQTTANRSAYIEKCIAREVDNLSRAMERQNEQGFQEYTTSGYSRDELHGDMISKFVKKFENLGYTVDIISDDQIFAVYGLESHKFKISWK